MKWILVNILNPGGKAASSQQKSCVDKGDIMTTMKEEKNNLGVLILKFFFS